MIRPAAKGWCPGALQPMMSGDGLLVRIRPRLGRLTRQQVEALCAAASAHGSGLMDLTSRGNVQMRGVTPDSYEHLLTQLEAVDLVDRTATDEARNNIIASPLWQPGDDTARIAAELGARLNELPALPTKFGFAIDASGPPVLSTASADIRVEKGVSGALIVRRDGAATGERATVESAVDQIIQICHWFVATGGSASKRMARHAVQPINTGDHQTDLPAATATALRPGPSPLGPVYGAPFGSMSASDVLDLVQSSAALALRTTPWRLFVLEGGKSVDSNSFISDPSDPVLHVAACPGAPYCPSATVDTRALAGELAGCVAGRLHVSGCAKGCAHPSGAAITVVGRAGKFDIVRAGCAWDTPEVTGLGPAEVRSQLGRA